MGAASKDGVFEIKPLPIIGPYGVQRFIQFGSEDTANFYLMQGQNTKRPYAMYPTMGRAHINYAGTNQLVFPVQPRRIFKTINYAYIVEGGTIYRLDDNFNLVPITATFANTKDTSLKTQTGAMYFTYLVVNKIVFACFVDELAIYIYQEDTFIPGNTGAFYLVTDPNAPGGANIGGTPGYIAAFGNRITVSVAESSQFCLSVINLGGNVFNPATCFTNTGNPSGPSVFAQEDGIIRQMGVLNNTLYIFCDFITGVWSNIQAVFSGTGATFPWKKSSTYNWNFGIATSDSLDIDFGYMAFLAQNSDGLLQFMYSQGDQPEKISDESIDALLQNYTDTFGSENPFTSTDANGFLYQYENSIFYRMVGGAFTNAQILDQTQNANAIEYKFSTKSWHRLIELNGQRNRIQDHIYFNSYHLVTVLNEGTIYEMSGRFYFNELRNPNQANAQASDAYLPYPFRYERVTPIISEPDYSEFETDYVQIDFVFGDSNINYSIAPFANTQFIIAEQPAADGSPQYIIDELPDSDGQPVFVIADGTDTPGLLDNTYNTLFNPNVELYYSDDGGISFNSADVLQFSNIGVYTWRMRWYQLGPSRNRVYKLICVSGVPIVVLGGVMNMRRISGGAN